MSRFNRCYWDNRRATTAALRAVLRDEKAKATFGKEWSSALANRAQRQRTILLKVIGVSLVPTGYLVLFLLNNGSFRS